MTQAWLIRAGRAGEREHWALTNAVSGGGFQEVPDLTAADTREAVTAAVATAYAGSKDATIRGFAAQMWSLRGRIDVGDWVVMPRKGTPMLAIGRVTGPYTYLAAEDPSLRHVRPVEWVATDIPRTAVKQDLLYSLGAFLTICGVKRNDAAHRISVLATTGSDPGARPTTPGPTKASPSSPIDDTDVSDETASQIDLEQYAFDRLSARVIETFAGHKMQHLVAAVLEAEGFTCTVPPPGPDQGVDVLGGTGPLGLDEPRLVVQVKSEASPVGSPVVGQLLGSMNSHGGSQGLLVAWGGITKPAEQMLTNQQFRVRVWTSKDLLEAVFRNYDRLSEEIRSELPLKRIWTLVEEAG